MFEFLKQYLSEETYNQLTKELDGKDVKVADLKSGDYVSKQKYDTLESELTSVKSARDSLQQKVDNGDGGQALQELQTKYDNDTQALNKQLEESKLGNAVGIALMKSGTVDEVSVRAHLGTFLKEAKIGEDGNIEGLAEQLNTLKQEKAYLFEEQPAGGAGAGNPPSGDEPKSLGDALKNHYK